MKYELTIAYRAYPGISKTPAIFPRDKYAMVDATFASLVRGCGNLRVKYHILLDNCPDNYLDIFKKYVASEHLIFHRYSGAGNGTTFGEQMKILLSQGDAENVFFCEDDYYFFDNSIVKMLESMDELPDAHFLTPYDHPDYYYRALHNYYSKITIAGNIHWRSAATTCMTFMTSKKHLAAAGKIFATYTRKNYDASLWAALTKKIIRNPRHIFSDNDIKETFKIYVKSWLYCWQHILFGRKYILRSPIPTLATHLEITGLAPGMDWKQIFSEQGFEVSL
ncbi:hypothetical protein MASR2M18_00540 [Ignavibacteria bacterium]|nr:glycosyltransferase family 2 protein [Bacteroidota bacterium]MCZ2131927.1 glycosyltransferase family 2 protein [Bacteroidota bacterium]